LVNAPGLAVFVASAEDLAMAKLEWLAQSQRQIEDVVAILKLRWESLNRPTWGVDFPVKLERGMEQG